MSKFLKVQVNDLLYDQIKEYADARDLPILDYVKLMASLEIVLEECIEYTNKVFLENQKDCIRNEIDENNLTRERLDIQRKYLHHFDIFNHIHITVEYNKKFYTS